MFFPLINMYISEYNPRLSLIMYHYSLMAYCPTEILSSWSCGTLCESPQLSGVLSFQSQNNSFFYLGYQEFSHEIYLVFRNSDFQMSINELLTIQYDQGVQFPNKNCTNCRVISKLYEHYEDLKQYVYNVLNYYQQFTNITIINFVGYGLGGSLAQLFALDYIQLNFLNLTSSIRLYTYGSPRIGNHEFILYCEKLMENKVEKFRMTFHKDFAPHVPLDFSQLTNEVFYDGGSRYQLCNDGVGVDDFNCSQKYLDTRDWDVEDHFRFFGYDSRELVKECFSKQSLFN